MVWKHERRTLASACLAALFVVEILVIPSTTAAPFLYVFGDQTGTALHETDDRFAFVALPNRDLMAIKKSGTGTNTTEVHILDASKGYKEFKLHTGTALHETDDPFAFVALPSRDLVAIKKSGTGTNTTEVHILDASIGYKEFKLHTGTALHETDDTFAFVALPSRDLVAIKKSGTGTNTTEVHILDASKGYKEFKLHTGTALHETDDTFAFVALPNDDLVAIKKSGAGTNTTEVHILVRRDISAGTCYCLFWDQTVAQEFDACGMGECRVHCKFTEQVVGQPLEVKYTGSADCP